jgi:GT2 family glycosyltransferase
VVIPSYRRHDALKSCLSGLAAQSFQPLEVIVVLRDDDDQSRASIEEANPSVRVVTVDRPGQVAALNRGCEAARGEFIAITDDDAVPRRSWLEAIASRFATDANIGAVGGRDVVHHDNHIVDGDAARVGRVFWWGRRVGDHHLRSHLQEVDFLKGTNMAFRAAALRPFDPHLRGEGAQVCNDLEATWSVRRRGWRVIYDPDVIVDHYPAGRHDGDGRDHRSKLALRNEQHNELYALLLHGAWWHRPILVAYRLFVGTRRLPGLLPVLLPGISTPGHPRVEELTLARLSAIRTLRSVRRATK